MKPKVAILIPTFNNHRLLTQLLTSLCQTMPPPVRAYCRIYVLNNGHPDLKKYIDLGAWGEVIDLEKNIGWEGALKYGVEHTTEDFLLFMNDDIHFPASNYSWVHQMLYLFHDPTVGAVGPISNAVMGEQALFLQNWTVQYKVVKFLIGFCLMVRREALVKAGGIDDSVPGGDDLDLSIRLRDQGYKLIATRDVYVHHHAFQTGTRVHGAYWNSQAMSEKTNNWLIHKHGFLKFWETITNQWEMLLLSGMTTGAAGIEKEVVRNLVTEQPILELGCGNEKTVEPSIGMDIIPKGEPIPQINYLPSVADLVGDVTQPLPVEPESIGTIIARHIMEHCLDDLQTMSQWVKVLKPGGRLIVTVPDHRYGNAITCNPEHVRGYSPESLANVGRAVGLVPFGYKDKYNGVSFTLALDKPK